MVNFNYVGTLKKNKTEIPAAFQPDKQKATHSSIFGFNNEKTLVSYVPKPNKAVVLISSEHISDAIVESNDSKPEIIMFYNKTKGSVDAFDQMVEKYTSRRKTNRWPFTVLMYMLDTAALNSAILFDLKHPDVTGARLRRKLLEELSCNLIKSCAMERYRESALKNHIGINKNIMLSFNRLIQVQRTASTESTTSTTARKRCDHIQCKGNNNKYVKKCQECNLIFCNNHCEILATIICRDCLLE